MATKALSDEDYQQAFMAAGQGGGEVEQGQEPDYEEAFKRASIREGITQEQRQVEGDFRGDSFDTLVTKPFLTAAGQGLRGLGGVTSAADTILGNLSGEVGIPDRLKKYLRSPETRAPKPTLLNRATQALRGKGQEYVEAGAALGGGVTSDIVAGLAGTITGSVPTIAAGIATGSLPAIVAMAGAQSFGEMKESGADILQERFPELSREDAISRAEGPAAVAGAVTAILTRVMPGGTEKLSQKISDLITRSGVDVAKQTLKSSVIREAGKEIPEEMIDQTVQGIIEKVEFNPDKSWEEIAIETAFAGVGGFTTGAAVGVVGKVVEKLTRPGKKADPEEKQSDPEEKQDPVIGYGVSFVNPTTGNVDVGTIVHSFKRGDTMYAMVEIPGSEFQMDIPFDQVMGTDVPGGPDDTPEFGSADDGSILEKDIVQPARQDLPTEPVAPGPEPVRELILPSEPVAPGPEPVRELIGSRHLPAVAQDFVQRIDSMGAEAPMPAQAKAHRIRQLLEVPNRNRRDNRELAALLNLKFDSSTKTIPKAYAFLATAAKPTAQATPPPDAGLPTTGQDVRPGTQAKPSPRPSSAQRGIEAVPLTPKQKRNYKGGQLIFIRGQRDRGPMEVVSDSPKAYRVRELATGKEFSVALKNVTLGRPANVESPSVQKKDQARDERGRRLKAAAQEDEDVAPLHQAVDTAEPLSTTPRAPAKRDPAKTQAGPPSTEGDVSYAPPVDPRDHFIARLLAAVMTRMGQRMPGVTLRRVEYVKTGKNEPVISVSPSPNGMDTVYVDMDRLAFDAKDMTPEQLAAYLESALTEEAIHIASGMAILEEWQRYGGESGTGRTFDQYYDDFYNLIYRDMTKAQADATVKAYGLDPDDHVRIAEEFVRGVQQKMMAGQTTEETLGDRIVAFLRQWVEQLNRMVQAMRSGALKNRMVDHILAINEIVERQEQAKAVGQQGVVARSGRRVGARVITKEQGEALEFNRPLMTPEQIQAIDTSAYIQNQAFFGHARAKWESAPDEVKGRLLPIKIRFDHIDKYGQRIGAPENDSRSLEEMIAQVPEQERQSMEFDAFESAHDFTEVHYQAQVAARIAADKLRVSQLNADKSGIPEVKKGVTKLKRALTREWKNKLLADMKAAKAKGRNVSGYKAQIDRIRAMEKQGSESIRRVASALFKDPNPNNLNAADVGIAQDVLDDLKDMAVHLGQPAIEKIRTEPLLPIQQEYEEAKAASDLMDDIAADSMFQRNLRYAYERNGAEIRQLNDSDTQWTVFDPYGETGEDGKPKSWVFTFNVDKGIDADNRDKAVDAAIRLEQYISDPGRHPGTEEHARRMLNRLYLYMNPHFDVGTPHLVGTDMNIWNIFARAMPALGNPESRVGLIPTRMATLALQSIRNMDQMHALVSQLHGEMAPEIEKAARKAAEGHGMDPARWSKDVLNPLLASFNSPGAPRLRVGDKVTGGIKISDLDMAAAKVQHDGYVSKMIVRLREFESVQNQAFPLKVSEKTRIIPIDRYAGHTSPLTMPQKMRPETRDYINEFRKANSQDPESRRATLLSVFAGQNTEAFRDVIMGHLKSSFYNSDYAAATGVSKDERHMHRNMSVEFDNDMEGAPKSVEDVIDRLFDDQAPAEDGTTLSKEDMTDRLFNQIWRSLKNVDTSSSQFWGSNDTSKTVQIASSDNFLNSPRTGLHLPIGLYDYTVTTPSAQWQIMHAAYEVYAQRYSDSLQKVKTELNAYIADVETRISNERSRLENQGVKSRKAGNQATRTVIAQTEKELKDGAAVMDYTMAHRMLTDVLASINAMSYAAQENNDVFNEQLGVISPISSAVRGIITQNALARPITASRNRIGGTLRLIQLKTLMGYAIRPLQVSLPLALQGTHQQTLARVTQQAATATVQTGVETTKLGAGFVKWMLGNGYISKAILANPKVKKYIEDHPEEMDLMAGWMIKFMQATSEEYDRQRYLGLAGSGKMWTIAQNQAALAWTGGHIRDEGQTKTMATLRMLETMLSMIKLYGGGIPWQAKSVSLITADQGANIAGSNYAGEMVNHAKLSALEYLQGREDMGILNRTVLLSPQELLGNPLATDRDAAFTRNLWAKSGIPIDHAMFDYYFRVKQADARGESRDSVPFLTEAQMNSLQMLLAEEVNRAGMFNRPEIFQKGEFGRWASLFFGYTSNHMLKFAEARARVSNQSRGIGSFTRGNITVLMLLFVTALLSWPGEELNRALSAWLFDERRQNKDNVKQEGFDMFRAFGEDAAPYLPLQLAIFNFIANKTVRQGAGVGPSGISLIPFTLAMDMIDTLRDVIQTEEAFRPMTKCINRYMPSWKVVTNRLPMNSGTVRYNNVQRSIRDAIPGSIEYRQPSPENRYQKTTTSDNKANILNALNMYGEPNWDTVLHERDLAVDDEAERGSSTPDVDVDNAVLSRAPMTAVLGRLPTYDERTRIMDRMSDEDRDELLAVEDNYKQYAGTFGRTVRFYREEDTEKKKKPAVQPLPRPDSGGGYSNPYIQRDNRDRLLRQ